MVERNMIREGFIFNTATSAANPTFSGSQILDEEEMTGLADENISISVVTVSATENINITADLGARWKLDRLELYTNDPSNSNIDMEISDNNIEFFPVTMTGSPNLYVGDILDSTVSGAPRYIRYHHAAASDLEVFEWKAINDDTLVDFGSDGTQAVVEIEDAPVGRVSDDIQNLKLFNKFHKKGSAFVFIEDTGNVGDELFEIATSTNGPWHSRSVEESLQPDRTPWVSGTLNGTRDVTSSGFYMRWYDQQSGNSWTAVDMTFNAFLPDPDNNGYLNWITTGNNPSYTSLSNYSEGLTELQTVTAGVGNIRGPHLRRVIQDTDLYDRVRVRMRVNPLALNDVVEGPRVRWRWLEDAGGDPFPIENSSLSQFEFNNFTGNIQDFVFKVGDVPTWSGAPYHHIRGLEISPFITATGIGNQWDLFEIEVYHSARKDRIVLDYQPTQSGIREPLIDYALSSNSSNNAWLFENTRITQPCIITKVMFMSSSVNTNATSGAFLYKETPDSGNYNFPGITPHSNPFPQPATPGGASGDNFEVKGTVQQRSMNGSDDACNEHWVFWKAEAGDMLGISRESQSTGWNIQYRVTTAADRVWYAENISGYGNGNVDMESNSACQTDLNNLDSYRIYTDRLYQIWCETVPIGDYLATGTYTTPVFDGGVQPALVSSSFVAIETRGSKIDSNTSAAFKTIKARASDFPPHTTADIGEVFNYDNFIWSQREDGRYPTGQSATNLGTFPVRKWINEENPAPAGNDWQINHINGFVTNREYPSGGNAIKNLAGAMMYHERDDELWVMNLLASGTTPNDLRPVWDVYNPDSLDYIRTDHLKGQLNYTYRHPADPPDETFEPVGFIYDTEQEEIYMVQRENAFFINTTTYYAAVMDLDGNFLRLSWRAGAMSESSTRVQTTTSLTFDGTYFYALCSNTNDSTNEGDILTIYKRGNDTIDDPTVIVEIVNGIDLSAIPGLEGADGNPKTQQCIFNRADGLLYLFFGDPLNSGDDPRFRNPELYALRVSIDPDTDTVNSTVKVPLVDPRGVSVTDGVRLSELGQRRSSYEGDWAGEAAPNDDTELIDLRSLNFFSASCYDTRRDVYNIISSHETEFWNDWTPRENWRDTNNYLYDKKTIQMFYACHAGTVSGTDLGTPIRPRGDDPKWGALSGTLSFESVQQNSILFPTGRYGQVEYTLNSSTDFTTTPMLLTSQLDQGIRVGDIPASGTTDLWLRTNIPEDQQLGDLTSGLKVFWELPE
jgi:hypothetical protein